jgi:ubiquinone/menaquinone biosynthesis C-methylase UbiE
MDKSQKTIAGYERCAAAFAACHFELGVYEQYIREFAVFLPPQARILDLGCGPGNIACFLHNHNPEYQITGVDFSLQMLRLARHNVPEARLIHQDLRTLELYETFDAVVISFCIIHLSEPEMEVLLRKSYHWLIPGGYLYVNFMAGGTPGLTKTHFSEAELYFNYYEPRQLATLLTTIGYAIISQKSRLSPPPDNQNTGVTDINEVFIIGRRPQMSS